MGRGEGEQPVPHRDTTDPTQPGTVTATNDRHYTWVNRPKVNVRLEVSKQGAHENALLRES